MLRDYSLVEAIALFEEHYPQVPMRDDTAYSISHLFYGCVAHLKSEVLFSYIYKCNNGFILPCARGWKIKAVAGGILIGVGAVVSLINPSVGGSIIATGGGLVIDGTAEGIDETDKMRDRDHARRREAEELDKDDAQLQRRPNSDSIDLGVNFRRSSKKVHLDTLLSYEEVRAIG